MTRKTILLLIAFIIMFSMAVPTTAYSIDNDYAEHWAEGTIQSWLDNGYVTGYTDGSFKPEGFITRAEFTKMINNLFGYTETADIKFMDVNKDDWYYKEIQKAFKAGYINGISKSKFAPNDNLTREQAAVIISKIMNSDLNSTQTSSNTFIDNDKVSVWAKDYVSSAAKARLIKGYDDNSFKPQNPIKRAEAVVTLNRTKITDKTDETDENKTIKILCIGNSFSQDATQYIYDIAQSAGVSVVIGNLYSSGCSLERHWKNAESNYSAYTYYKWTSPDMQTTEKQTIKAAVLDEKWDYITFQQFSGDSGFYSTFQPYLNKLSGYVKKLSPNSKLALNMTWSYASDSTHEYFASYNNNQKSMYYSIADAYNQAIIGTDIDIIIPCGTAIQNARTNPYLNVIDDDLTRDGHHLNTGIGRYIAGLTFFQTLIVNQESITKDLFTDVSFIPDTIDSNEDLAYLAKIAVINAVKYPFIITYDKTEAVDLDLNYVTHCSIPIDPLFFTGIKFRKASNQFVLNKTKGSVRQ